MALSSEHVNATLSANRTQRLRNPGRDSGLFLYKAAILSPASILLAGESVCPIKTLEKIES
jgi:hypothetical protein